MGVYLPGGFATQGPCPDGFHVPLTDEWRDLFGILTNTFGLASTGTTMQTYLKMPLAGYRSRSSGDIGYQDMDGYYWSSSRYDANYAYYSLLYASLMPQNYAIRSMGFTIRGFKNSPVAPDNTWTMLYDGSGIAQGAGIFHNTTLGLISVSGDGINWTTISDKNVGATTVYNSGDTLSESNCGGYFQRGNNYMFPFTGSVTTSSTRVDASTYGPGNYYSSSTFITYNGRWDTTDNGNLRGGVDGNVPTMSELQNAYIGDYGWHPGANTILYLPLESDTNDHSGNSYTITQSGTITKSDIGYQFGSNGRSYLSTPSLSLDDVTDLTVCFWQYVTTVPSISHIIVSKYIGYNSRPWICFNFGIYNHSSGGYGHKINFMIGNTSDTLKEYYSTSDPLGGWKLIIGTLSSGTMKLYINGTLDGSVSSVGTFKKVNSPIYIGAYQATNNEYLVGKLSKVIIESKPRTEQEIADYYNQTKGNYGIS